jgi:molecular chaperone GrpE
MSDKKPRQPKPPMPIADDSLKHIEELKEQLTALTEALQRERADAINLRRRYEEQLANARASAKASIIGALLPAIDNFERALKHVPAELEANDYVKGVRGVVKQFERALEELGVLRIDTVGQSFNPELHEAVSMEEGDGTREIVTEELQPGYRLDNGIVLRHAMVKVRTE